MNPLRFNIGLLFLYLFVFSGCNSQKKIIQIDFGNDTTQTTDSAKTVNSIRKIDDIFVMNYYGSYEEKVEYFNKFIIANIIDTVFKLHHNIVSTNCSIFTIVDDPSEIYLGRNFDSDRCGILLAKYNPPGKYRSIAFSRMEELHFNRHLIPLNITEEQKQHFLFFPFYAVDGINEMGLAVGIAGVNSQRLKLHHDKEAVFVTYFIRKILDNCKDVDEVITLSKNLDLFDGSLTTISHHFLIADIEGNSLIIEYKNGEMKYIEKTNKDQLITNRYVYESTIESNKKCWRYEKLYEQIVNKSSEVNAMRCMLMLESVYNNTTWSVVYDVKSKSGIIAAYNDYNSIYKFNF